MGRRKRVRRVAQVLSIEPATAVTGARCGRRANAVRSDGLIVPHLERQIPNQRDPLAQSQTARDAALPSFSISIGPPGGIF
jgi:hypothetical protein